MSPRHALVAASLTCVLIGSGAAAGDAWKAAAEASVFIRTIHTAEGEHLDSSGSGFFISREGHVLTSAHVVSDSFYVLDRGRYVRVVFPVVTVEVVVDSGERSERTYAARILARDEDADLALLQVAHVPTSWIDVRHNPDLAIGLEVTAIGFPFGDMLAVQEDLASDADENPEVSVTFGRITSLRRNNEGDLLAVQTDASINSGNSGGVMITPEGEFVGVVFARVPGAGLGFATPCNRVRTFLQRESARITFRPAVVTMTRVPIEVRVEPGHYGMEAVAGTVSIEGGDIDPFTVALTATAEGLHAMLPIPPRLDGRDAPDHYLVTVQLDDDRGQEVVRRLFRLPAADQPPPPAIDRGARSSSEMSLRKDQIGGGMTLSDYVQRGRLMGSGELAEGRVTAGMPPPREEPPPPPAPDPDLAGALAARGRELLEQGMVDEAVEVLEKAVAADLGHAEATRLLEDALTRERGAIEAAAVVSGEAQLTVSFYSPLARGSVVLRRDGDLVAELPFQFGRRGGRMLETVALPAGRYDLQAELVGRKGALGTLRQQHLFRPGSTWRLRINLPAEDARAQLFLIEVE